MAFLKKDAPNGFVYPPSALLDPPCQTPTLRRDPQALSPSTSLLQRPAVGAPGQVQGCGKKDPFSPQARWGDDGARQVRVARH